MEPTGCQLDANDRVRPGFGLALCERQPRGRVRRVRGNRASDSGIRVRRSALLRRPWLGSTERPLSTSARQLGARATRFRRPLRSPRAQARGGRQQANEPARARANFGHILELARNCSRERDYCTSQLTLTHSQTLAHIESESIAFPLLQSRASKAAHKSTQQSCSS